MTAKLLHELAWLFKHEADVIAGVHAWPPRTMTAEERYEVRRLDATAQAIRYRGDCAAYEEQS